jgi:asparagine synthetase B (glutamine-hydrolysing)
MCGIFGVLAGKGSSFAPTLFEPTVNHLFKLSESRGKEASGLAFLSEDTIQVYKRPVSASSLIRSEEYKEIFKRALTNGASSKKDNVSKPVIIIGHSRLVTSGSQGFHQNNQPIIKSGMVGVHNGIITNDGNLWKQFPSIKRQYEIDTEVLLSLIRLFYNEKRSIIEAVQAAFSNIRGYASVAILFEDFNYMTLATNNGSLYLCSSKAGNVHVFASEQYILKMLMKKNTTQKLLGEYDISHVEAGSGFLISLNDLGIKEYSLDSTNGHDIPTDCSGLPKNIVDVLPLKEDAPTPGRKKSIGGPFVLSKTFDDQFPENEKMVASLKRCSKCVLPETMPFIEFDDKGVCNFCLSYKKLELQGTEALEESVANYRSKSGEPDCIVAFSGGRDSSYALHYIKKVLKMNPVAYTYDWGMVTDLARRNQSRLCGQLGIEHILISADINWKRNNIRKNVEAWLKKPDLGTIPLFMAGDKQFFWYANKLRSQIGPELVFINENKLEKTDFKFGFCGVRPVFAYKHYIHTIPLLSKATLAAYYGKEFLTNPSYLNSSIWDTLYAYACYYVINHSYLSLYDFIEWNEEVVDDLLIDEYDWEIAKDTNTTWRIGDGTAPFYNYIYYTIAGLTENDTFRSNQIREGVITREKALTLVNENNRPRYESINWYCDTIGIDFYETIKRINATLKLYVHQ